MSTYGGHMWLAPNWSDQIEVQLVLENELIILTSRSKVIGEWEISDVDIEFVEDRIHLFVEGEHLIISTGDADLVAASRQAAFKRARWEDVAPEGKPARETASPRGAHRADERMLWKW